MIDLVAAVPFDLIFMEADTDDVSRYETLISAFK